jgi:alkylhydroperoxidase family enzyme
VQRSVRSGSGSIPEAKYAKLLHFATSDEFSEREKAALTYTSAIIWDAGIANDALWDRLHASFSDAELVELGFFVGLTLGQQRWIKTLGIGHHEVMAGTEGGLAPASDEKDSGAG